MKKLLFVLSMLIIGLQMNGENKYVPSGTTWIEISKTNWWSDWDTTTYIVKDEVLQNGIAYNEVLANGKRYCLIREEGPLVYMWIDEYENGLLYDFDWWEGKDYLIDFPDPFGADGEFYHDVINKIDEMVLEDGQTYKIWTPYNFDEGDYIICGVGATNGILKYFWPIFIGEGDGPCLLEFTRDVQLYNKDNGLNGLKEMGTDSRQKSTRSIRLKRNETGGYDLQVKNSDGSWQIVK